MDPKPGLDEQERYYTMRWNEFVHANALDLARMAAVLDALAGIGWQTPPRICDLGCGAGWSTNILSAFGPTTGVDLSDTTVAAARYPQCTFVSANVLEWDPGPALFDVVVSIEVIEHIERDLHARYLDAAYRLLRPGGHLILTTPNADTMRAMAHGGREWSNQPLEEWLTPAELRRLVARRFRLLDLQSIVSGLGARGSYRPIHSVKLRRLARAVGLERGWVNVGLRTMHGLHLVAVAQKSG